jgi:hypothetical protein
MREGNCRGGGPRSDGRSQMTVRPGEHARRAANIVSPSYRIRFLGSAAASAAVRCASRRASAAWEFTQICCFTNRSLGAAYGAVKPGQTRSTGGPGALAHRKVRPAGPKADVGNQTSDFRPLPSTLTPVEYSTDTDSPYTPTPKLRRRRCRIGRGFRHRCGRV